jgi:3-methyladenine DNA glycosylase/8-oxoguanine DNA glycosylase
VTADPVAPPATPALAATPPPVTAPVAPVALIRPAGPGRGPEPGTERDWLVPFPLDVRLILSVHARGPGDPAYRVDESGAVWRTSLTPDGPATLRLSARQTPPAKPPQDTTQARHGIPAGRGTRILAGAWGPGAGWLLDRVPALLGFADDPAGLAVHHAVVGELMFRFEGMRVGRSGRLFEALVPAVLEQKVVSLEAHRAWRYLVAKHGEPAPGPTPNGMRVCPAARTWARIPSWDWHRAGVEGVRARTIIGAAEVAGRLEETLGLPPAEADRRLRSLPGIGPWTSAEIRQRAAGDPDAVSVGDYHLPNVVGWTLARRDRTDDAGMLELLAPYAGQRYRVTRLIELGGGAPPRRGPRMPVRDYRSF